MTRDGVLKGIRVLDFSRVLAGPCTTRILGDFGAEIIKVQSAMTATGAEDQASPYFAAWNRNKLSIRLNMGLPASKQLALKLVAASDVVIENFSPRVMANWGLDYEALCRVKPDIIMAGMSAMGCTGPWKNYTAYAPTLHSLAGHTLLNSYEADNPMGLEFSLSDIVAGLYCALAVLAALEHRNSTGLGRYIDLSQYEAACTLLGPALMDAAAQYNGASPNSGRYVGIAAAPHGCYPCAGVDRWCAISVYNQRQWRQLCSVLGNPQWTKEDRFATPADRIRNHADLDKHMTAWTSGRQAREITDQLQNAGVPAAMVADARDLVCDPHLTARGYFVGMAHPLLGRMTAERSPIRFVGAAGPFHQGAPLLGEHNEYVYKEVLGLSDKTYNDYLNKGAFT